MAKTIVQRERAFQISYEAIPNRCRFTYPVSAEFIKLTFSHLEDVREIDLRCIRGKFEKLKKRWYYVLDAKVDTNKPEKEYMPFLDTYVKVQLYVDADFTRIQQTMKVFKLVSKESWNTAYFIAVYHSFDAIKQKS